MRRNGIKQNAHYTFKYNAALGRHGWLRLTPAYSVRLVEEILAKLDYSPRCVLDPFSGTGTTGLVCANRGVPSLALEINPFLVWLGNTKLAIYPNDKVAAFLSVAKQLMQNIESYVPVAQPPIYKICRWWGARQVDFLARVKAAFRTIQDEAIAQLLAIAFCRVVIEFSNASFNHVSTSFGDPTDAPFSTDVAKATFLSVCEMVADGASSSPQAPSKVIAHDSRSIPAECIGKYDTVITSPPYPNRISYIRELRPYMYWLDYLKTSEQASDLDWRAIGGTWGRATSLLGTWESRRTLPHYVYDIGETIAGANNKSAALMANYVLKYFEDMQEHLSSAYAGLSHQGSAFYIIGNSNFYGITVPAEKIYADMMNACGFVNVKVRVVRKRNCNRQLYEFIVSGKKQ